MDCECYHESALQREYSYVVALNSNGHPEDAIVKAYDQHTLVGPNGHLQNLCTNLF